MRNVIFSLILGLALSLAACSPPPKLTFAQQQLEDAKQQCQEEASSMNPESPNSMNPYWDDYFVMCMQRFGYTDKEIRQLWY